MALRILIIEDDPSFLDMVMLRLKSWRDDLAFTVAKTLSEAHQKLDIAKAPFDLIILDQHLPDGLGADLLSNKSVQQSAVLAVSSDDSPEIPSRAVKAGAAHFLGKRQVSEKLFLPLVEAILSRKKMERELISLQVNESKLKTIRTLVSTLQHEINNPLGAVLGGVYLLQHSDGVDDEQKQAVRVIESSANRIRHVLEQLSDAIEFEEVVKGSEELFHIPGDKPWEK